MADIIATTGGFSGTTVEFTAQTDAGKRWLEFRGGFACEAITCSKSQASAGYADIAEHGLTVALA
jgi:hypothetical protein